MTNKQMTIILIIIISLLTVLAALIISKIIIEYRIAKLLGYSLIILGIIILNNNYYSIGYMDAIDNVQGKIAEKLEDTVNHLKTKIADDSKKIDNNNTINNFSKN